MLYAFDLLHSCSIADPVIIVADIGISLAPVDITLVISQNSSSVGQGGNGGQSFASSGGVGGDDRVGILAIISNPNGINFLLAIDNVGGIVGGNSSRTRCVNRLQCSC